MINTSSEMKCPSHTPMFFFSGITFFRGFSLDKFSWARRKKRSTEVRCVPNPRRCSLVGLSRKSKGNSLLVPVYSCAGQDRKYFCSVCVRAILESIRLQSLLEYGIGYLKWNSIIFSFHRIGCVCVATAKSSFVSFFLSLLVAPPCFDRRRREILFFSFFFHAIWRLTSTTIGSVWFLRISEMPSFFCQFYSWKRNKEELLYQDVCIMRRERETTTNVTITSQWK